MAEEQHNMEEVPIGRPMVSWQIDEYPRLERSTRWYWLMAAAAAACIIYAVFTANFLFAVIILMIGIITLVTTFQKPERVDVVVTTTGIVIGELYYEYRAIKDFSMVYDPPRVKVLYLTFQSPWRPLLAIPLEDTDPNLVRESLLPFCLENLQRNNERLTDRISRMYKM